jgi:molybdopterin/thiamine biosynthesis adenylyltransferase
MPSTSRCSHWLRSVRQDPDHEWPVADIIRIRIRGTDYEQLRKHLVPPDQDRPKEHAAYLVAGTQEYEERGEQVLEYLVRDIHLLNRDEYLEQSTGIVRFDHTTVRAMMGASETEHRFLDDMALLMCHSHPSSRTAKYSGTDDENEPPHIASLTGRTSGPHGSLIFGRDGLTGRAWVSNVPTIRHEPITAAATPIDELVVIHDRELERVRTTDSRLDSLSDGDDEMRDRQALLHGEGGNAQLREGHVAVVGAGGLGTQIVQTLAHLGIGAITVVDPDIVEESNRSRIVGAQLEDAGVPDQTPDEDGVVPAAWAEAIDNCGIPKVEVLGRLVSEIDPSIYYRGIHEEIQAPAALGEVVAADIIVTGTDTATSRRYVSEAAQQYLRPLFNAGTDIDVDENAGTRSIATSFQVSGTNRPCLDCMGVINEDRIDAEGQDEEDLEYGLELVAGEQPSVITINQEPVQRLTFALHRFLTGLLADRHGFRTGTYSATADRLISDIDAEPDCRFCDGTFTGAGDRGVPIAMSNLYRTTPSTVPTGAIAELGTDAFSEDKRLQQATSAKSQESTTESNGLFARLISVLSRYIS